MKIEYKPKDRRTIKVGELEFRISTPKTKILPKIIEVKQIADMSKMGGRDPKAMEKYIEILIDILQYNYSENSREEIELMINDNLEAFMEKYFEFLGVSKEEEESFRRQAEYYEKRGQKN